MILFYGFWLCFNGGDTLGKCASLHVEKTLSCCWWWIFLIFHKFHVIILLTFRFRLYLI